MLKRVVAITVGILTAALTMGPVVEAGTGTISGTSCTSCVCFSCTTGAVVSCTNSTAWKTCNAKRCSIGVESLLKALGNLTSGSNSEDAALRVSVFLQDVRFVCRNSQGKQQNANAPHFLGETRIVLKDAIEPASVQKNGRALSNVGILNPEILEAAGVTSTEDFCPNKINWTVEPVVEKMRVLGELFFDPNPSSVTDGCVLNPDPNHPNELGRSFDFQNCELRDALGVQCFAPPGARAGEEFNYVGESGSPPCDTLCHNSTGPTCGPDGLPLQ